MSSEEQGKGFQVRDRRRFTETGEPREDVSGGDETPSGTGGEPKAGTATVGDAPRSDERTPPRSTEPEGPVEITLTTFLMSLSTQALMLLGDIPNPMTGKTESDLDGAQEIIALIGMLEEKTRGNLDASETRLIDKILYDLRMRYVEQVRK